MIDGFIIGFGCVVALIEKVMAKKKEKKYEGVEYEN